MTANLPEAFTRAFAIDGRCLSVAPLGRGHIHETLVGTWQGADGRSRRVVHQRINTHVFRDPELLQRNWLRVTGHVRAALEREGVRDLERRCLEAIPTRDGAALYTAADGSIWRAFPFIPGTRAVDVPESPAQAEAAARAFGRFGAQLGDLPTDAVGESIPRFHDFAFRLENLERAAGVDAWGRAAAVTADLAAARELAARVTAALAEAEAARLPRRVVHNDCKLNNVLFDEATGEALCVIDLDTVMPGNVLADFGDLVRTAACPAAEDEVDLARVRVDDDLYAALLRGYLAGAASLLEPVELAALPLAGPLIALETGLRFLTDHLEGDVYFRIHRPDQNRDRARTQLRLTERLLAGLDVARRLVEARAREVRGLVEVGR